MVQFQKITDKNFIAILDMKQAEGRHFVPPNAESLAQAWMYGENRNIYAPVYSFAICEDGVPVGFMQLYDKVEKGSMYLWRVMIDASAQGRGLGTAAVKKVIDLVKASGKYSRMELGCKPENAGAIHLYEKLGFCPAGELEDGELPMRLDFQ